VTVVERWRRVLFYDVDLALGCNYAPENVWRSIPVRANPVLDALILGVEGWSTTAPPWDPGAPEHLRIVVDDWRLGSDDLPLVWAVETARALVLDAVEEAATP
jgi:hypothetical protein